MKIDYLSLLQQGMVEISKYTDIEMLSGKFSALISG
mgnify:CR=1 FL=1